MGAATKFETSEDDEEEIKEEGANLMNPLCDEKSRWEKQTVILLPKAQSALLVQS